MREEQLPQRVDHIARVQPALDTDGQTRTGELINDAEHAENPAIMRSVLNKIIGPDMALILWPQPDT